MRLLLKPGCSQAGHMYKRATDEGNETDAVNSPGFLLRWDGDSVAPCSCWRSDRTVNQ